MNNLNLEEEKKSDQNMKEVEEEEKGNEPVKSQDEINIEKAYALKDEGNFFFKQKDYKKAIAKYCRVELFVKPIAPLEGGDSADPGLMMAQGMNKSTVTKETKTLLHEL